MFLAIAISALASIMAYARARIVVEGEVQGIGYRNFVRTRATMQGITGWVMNLDDGRVEAVLEGEKEVIERVIEICRKGPLYARVSNIYVKWEDKLDGYSSFTIKR